MRILTKEDVLDYMLACTTLSTGGVGVAPSLEAVGRMVDEVLAEGHELRLVSLEEVPDDAVVFSSCGTGGDVRSEMKDEWKTFPRQRLTRDMRHPIDRQARIRDLIMQARAPTWR